MMRGTESDSDPEEGCTSSHDLVEHRLFVLEKFLYKKFPSKIEKLLRSNECRKWRCCGKKIPPGLWHLMDLISESEEAAAPKEILGKVRQRDTHKSFRKGNTSSKDAGFTILSTQTESRVEDISSTDIPLDKEAPSQSLGDVEASLPTSVESAKSTPTPTSKPAKAGTFETRNHSNSSTFTAEEASQDSNEALQNEVQFRQARNPVLPFNPLPSPPYNNESSDVDVVTLSSDEEEVSRPTILKPKRSKKKKGIKQHLTIVHPTSTTLMRISQPVPQNPAQPSSSIIRSTAPKTARKSATQVPASTASDIVAPIKELNRATEEQSPVHVQQQVVKQKDKKTGEMVHQLSTTSTGSFEGKMKGSKRKQKIPPTPPEPPTMVSCQDKSTLDIGMPSFSIPLKSLNRNDYYSDSDDSLSVDSVPQNTVLLEHDVSLAISALSNSSAEPSKSTPAVLTPPAATITITTSSSPADTAASTHDVVTTVTGQLEETSAPPLSTTPVAVNLEDVSNIPSTSTKASNISPYLPEDGVSQAVNEKLSDSTVPRRKSTKKKSDFCKRCAGYFESLDLHNHEIHKDESEEEDEPDRIDSDGDEGMIKGPRKRKTPKRFMDNNYINDSSGRKKISEVPNSVKNPAEQPVPPPAPEVLKADQVRRKRGRPSKKQRAKHLTDTKEKNPKNQVVSAGDSNRKTDKPSFNSDSDDEPLTKRNARFNNDNRRRKISLKEPVSSNSWRTVDTFKSSSSDSDDDSKYRKRHKPHFQTGMAEGPVAGSSRSEYPHHYLRYPPHEAAASPNTSDDENAYDVLANSNGNNQMASIRRSRLSQNDLCTKQSNNGN